ncbi:L-rhamnose-binding lectin CSL3-like, partial [Xiphophorus hellerii]|uniref:L-rhamnose-binding lectin CSL3-like n=1 Tax=Xiphophorus hellerii TaxID=8084 RepID=UPI0013B45E8C
QGKSSSGACLPEEKSLVACEGTVARLHCEEGQAIYVTSATYGRTDKKTCSARRLADQLENTECFTYAEEVGERCNGKQWCKVKASNYVFGDPCYGTYKYLEVEYICYDLADQLENTECFTYAEEVGERCNGKQWCKVKASNYVFGDPCYETYKYLEVEYICYEVPQSCPE